MLVLSVSKNYQLNKSKYLLESEQQELNRVLELFKQKEPRDVSLIFFALNTGARATELLNVTWEDLDDQDQTVFIKGIKGSNDREIPIKQKPFDLLYSLKNNSAPTDRVFKISYPRLVQIWHNYRPCHKKFHSLRHSFALNLYKKTKDLRLVQVALGHKNIQNTMIYAEYVYSTEELKKLIL